MSEYTRYCLFSAIRVRTIEFRGYWRGLSITHCLGDTSGAIFAVELTAAPWLVVSVAVKEQLTVRAKRAALVLLANVSRFCGMDENEKEAGKLSQPL